VHANMNILLAGASGQLGRELRPLIEPLGRVVGADRDVLPGDSNTLEQDLADRAGVSSLLQDVQPGLIINAAAYTAVDAAEDDRDTAFLLNAKLPEQLASWAARHGAWFVHYSTDYVFPGDATRPYREGDSVAPLNVYGESKQAGEAAVLESGCRHLLLRTSWVYSGHGNNFALSMLRLAAERETLSIVDDQHGCPTWARNLARVSRDMLDRVLPQSSGDLSGLYHYCDRDAVSWCTFAKTIFDTAKSIGLLDNVPTVESITSDEYPQKAKRPAYSVLDADLARRTFGIEQPSLRESLETCLEELKHARR